MEIDMMTPQFFEPFQDTSPTPEIEFSGRTQSAFGPIFQNPNIQFPGNPFQQHYNASHENTFPFPPEKRNSMAAMREIIYRIAAMQPIHIDPESVKPPKRRNVRISKDPQSVAARHRRERISERIRILQRLVPGGTKMDTVSMLDEAIHYVKFLKKQIQTMEEAGPATNWAPMGVGFPATVVGSLLNFSSLGNANC